MSGAATYGAATAKARAMYAKRLREEDWQHLEEAETVRRVSELLHQSAAWPLAEPTDDPAALRDALRAQTEDSYRRLCLYLRKPRDLEYMAYFLRRRDHALSLSNEDYQAAWDCIDRNYRGLSRLALRKLLGAEADILNLIYLLRLRRFPASLPEAERHLIPVRLALKKRLIGDIVQAPDDGAVTALLKGTPWEAALADLRPAALDGAYRRYMERFCRKLVTGADATAAAPVAWMMLVELDRQRLDRLVEALRLGLGPNHDNNKGR